MTNEREELKQGSNNTNALLTSSATVRLVCSKGLSNVLSVVVDAVLFFLKGGNSGRYFPYWDALYSKKASSWCKMSRNSSFD